MRVDSREAGFKENMCSDINDMLSVLSACSVVHVKLSNSATVQVAKSNATQAGGSARKQMGSLGNNLVLEQPISANRSPWLLKSKPLALFGGYRVLLAVNEGECSVGYTPNFSSSDSSLPPNRPSLNSNLLRSPLSLCPFVSGSDS